MKRIISLFIIICALLPVSGCGTWDKIKSAVGYGVPEATDTPLTDTTRVSNNISVGLLDFDTFNPLLTKSQTVRECMQFVYEPLFELDEKLRPVPVLAESYTVSADGRTIDIQLKNNILWHDGSNLTAYDVAYTIKQIRAGITTYTSSLLNMADYMATGDYSIQIVLNYAVPNFVSLLTFPIVQFRTDMKLNPNYTPVGTGPYRLETQLDADKISFIAFDSYHDGKAKIDNVYAYTVPDLIKYESMFEASEIDLMTSDTVDLSEYTPRGSIKNNEYVTNKITFAGYNCQSPIFSGAQTRIGISKLIDKEDIVNSTIYSRGVMCDIPINPSSIYYYDTNTSFHADEVLAAQHLGNDGWGLDEDGYYIRHVNGKKQTLSVDILTNGDSEEKVSIANEIAGGLNKFGIPAEVDVQPYERYIQKIEAKDYDIMIGEVELGANLDLTPLVSSAGNYFSYYNPSLDMLTGQLGMTTDEEQLKALFRQYGDTVLSDMPFSVLFYRKGNVLSGAKIKTEIVPVAGCMFRGVETWSVMQ